MNWSTVADSGILPPEVAMVLVPLFVVGYAALSSEVFTPLAGAKSFPRWLAGRSDHPNRAHLAFGIPLVVFGLLMMVALCIGIAVDSQQHPVTRLTMSLGLVAFTAWTAWVVFAVARGRHGQG